MNNTNIAGAGRWESWGRVSEILSVLAFALAGISTVAWLTASDGTLNSVMLTISIIVGIILLVIGLTLSTWPRGQAVTVDPNSKCLVNLARQRTLRAVGVPRDVIGCLREWGQNAVTQQQLTDYLKAKLGETRLAEVQELVLKYTRLDPPHNAAVNPASAPAIVS